MRQATRRTLAAAIMTLAVAPAFAQGSGPASPQAATPAPANRPATAATPANPGGSVTQAQPAQRPATQGNAGQQTGTPAQRPAQAATPATPAPRATN